MPEVEPRKFILVSHLEIICTFYFGCLLVTQNAFYVSTTLENSPTKLENQTQRKTINLSLYNWSNSLGYCFLKDRCQYACSPTILTNWFFGKGNLFLLNLPCAKLGGLSKFLKTEGCQKYGLWVTVSSSISDFSDLSAMGPLKFWHLTMGKNHSFWEDLLIKHLKLF